VSTPDPAIDTTLRVIVPVAPNQPPPSVRLRRWLKEGLRVFGVRVEWAPAPQTTATPSVPRETHEHLRRGTTDHPTTADAYGDTNPPPAPAPQATADRAIRPRTRRTPTGGVIGHDAPQALGTARHPSVRQERKPNESRHLHDC
jgi:hypothetical protein